LGDGWPAIFAFTGYVVGSEGRTEPRAINVTPRTVSGPKKYPSARESPESFLQLLGLWMLSDEVATMRHSKEEQFLVRSIVALRVWPIYRFFPRTNFSIDGPAGVLGII